MNEHSTPVLASHFESPLGRILLLMRGRALVGLYFEGQRHMPPPDPGWRWEESAFGAVKSWLESYFSGGRRRATLRLEPSGTPFQQQVWKELEAIPSGGTISYAGIAGRVGKPTAVRAVGTAIGRNPISILIPCHRVVGSSGALTGYAGGLQRKQWLLEHEGQTRNGCS